MSIMRWEPFNELVSLREAMDRLFEESYVRPRDGAPARGILTPPTEVQQSANEIVVRVALPGVSPEDVDINVLGDTLTIKGEIKEQKSSEQGAYLLREFRYGQFGRALTLPVPVDASKAQASFENGIVTLRLPKVEAARPRQIKLTPGNAAK